MIAALAYGSRFAFSTPIVVHMETPMTLPVGIGKKFTRIGSMHLWSESETRLEFASIPKLRKILYANHERILFSRASLRKSPSHVKDFYRPARRMLSTAEE